MASGTDPYGDLPYPGNPNFTPDRWETANVLPLKKNRETGQWAWAVPNTLADMLSGVAAPGKAWRGEYPTLVDQLTGVNYQPGMAEDAASLAGALTLGGGAVPKAANTLGIFGGMMAKTADKAALAQAEKMAKSGATRDEIWNATGWFKGKDDKWRFEIDDSASTIRPNAMAELTAGEDGSFGATQRYAPGVLAHPKLYQAYPDLKYASVDARYNKALAGNSGAISYRGDSGGRPEITTQTNAINGPGGTHGVILHEAQHAIEDTEGFAQGGNLSTFSDMIDPQAIADARVMSALIRKGVPIDDAPAAFLNAVGRDVKPEARALIQEFSDNPQGLYDMPADPREAYKRLAGETEARNVQTRMDLTPEQRRAKAPWYTQDVPDDRQIVRFWGD
tara:strand:+ start:7355 stop:8530 length:1176 start_codon:yes stop_codon:yes gene_type:complete